MRLTRDIFCCTIKTIKPLKNLEFQRKKHSILRPNYAQIFSNKTYATKINIEKCVILEQFRYKT